MLSRLARLVPDALARRLARFAIPFAVAMVGLVLLAGLAAAALLSPGTLGIAAARVSDTNPLDTLSSGLSARDSDNDGVSDALENYLYGTDPNGWDSAGLGIPDGWLVQYGFDPLDPRTATARGAAPTAGALPAAYADGYPDAYRPDLSTYYAYAKPVAYRPGVDAPWWRQGDHADPVATDQTGTGIPTGWLLARNVPLRELDPDRVATGSKGNLTIRQAWEYDTDPYADDSDADGIPDWNEIFATKTDPSRFSTSGSGIADGWLLRFGLAVGDPDVGTRDPDLDGLTNREEFDISRTTFRAEVATQGIPFLYARGLNPLDWETAGTGIPDGWYVRYGLSPFGADVERVIGKASDFAEYRTYTPEGAEPLPDITFTVRGAYEYARPSDWNESRHGVWWGGTNPDTGDSDDDGLPDAVEIRGWYANATFDTGPEAKPRVYRATSNPLEPDSDSDGLTDVEEYRGVAQCAPQATRAFPPTDPRNRDTAFSGLSDLEKVCGVLRGDVRYDLGARGGGPGLDPTRADSAADHLRDGARVAFWHERYDALRQSPRYPYEDSAYRTVFEWTELYARFAGLSRDQTLAQFRPDGDADGDGVMNVADADPSGGLYVEKFDPTSPKTKVYFLGGPQIDPTAYRLTEFTSPIPHSATDPANPDTDGDGLPDAWETRYGRFDAVAGGWDLDPAKSDSDGDGVTDDKANNDGDVVVWYAFDARGSVTERSRRTFAFTNDLEFLAKTDPNEVSSADDGVPDGWKVFWGSRVTAATYPNLIASRDPIVGSVALAAASDIETLLAEIGPALDPTRSVKGLGWKATGYVRLQNVSACGTPAELAAFARPGEQVPVEDPCYAGRNLEGADIKVARFYAVKRLTYADEARLGTNPFMDDTDGDGAPDAYEAHYLLRSSASASAYPDPVVDDRAKDPDGDGLGIADECAADGAARCAFETFSVDDVLRGAGADPNDADTDGDGIPDGIEAAAPINPLNPADVRSFANANQDQDRDGIPDYLELTGWGKLEFGEPVRTSPGDADTDGDGLLDGETRVLGPLTDASLVTAWRARGIAHETLANGSITFLGEKPNAPLGVRPDTLDAAVDGVPDGWVAYHGLDATRTTVDPAPYKAGRPTWWREALHGVWWWGEKPGVPAPADADGDGLHDRNGEDPMPATRTNRVLVANQSVTDPAALEALVKAAGDGAAQRLVAQRLGDGAGDPDAARAAAVQLYSPTTNVYYREERARVAVLDVVAPASVNKGQAFNVTGRLVLDERNAAGQLLEGSEAVRVGVPNRTVVVSVFSAGHERVIGGGFTTANGSFTIRANITAESRVPVPTDVPLAGTVKGTAVLRFDPSLVTPGETSAGVPNRLVVWAYNTSSTVPPGHPQHAPHLARLADRGGVVAERTVNATAFAASAPVAVVVKATTRVEFEVASAAENGKTLEGEIKLVDASGAPVPDRLVVLRWSGATPAVELSNASTDRNGRINLTNLGIPVGVVKPGRFALVANFTSRDVNLIGTASTWTVDVRHPTILTATPDQESATIGDTLSVSGELRTRTVRLTGGREVPSAPLSGASVVVAVGGVEESAATDEGGRYTVRIVLPGSLSAGQQRVAVRFEGDGGSSSAATEFLLGVRRTARVSDLTPLEGPRTIDVTLRGRLVDNEGQGFSGRIEVHAASGVLATGAAPADGRFAIAVPLGSLKLGPQQIRVVFPGDLAHAAAENITTARVTTLTRIVVDVAPESVVRGRTFAVGARLLDDADAPVPGQPIAGTWRGERVEVLITDADGRVSFLIPTNRSDRPAPGSVGLVFAPSATAVHQPATAAREVRLLAGTTLDLPTADVRRGPVGIAGRLLDDDGRPIAAAPIVVRLDGALLGETRTSRNGSFEIQRTLAGDTRLGAHQVSASYLGTATLAGALENRTWRVRSPLDVTLDEAGPFVRGEGAPLAGRLADDRGAPVDVVMRVVLAGHDMGSLTPADGRFSTGLDVPEDAPRGAATLRITAAGTDAYEPLLEEIPVVVKIRPKVEVQLPALAVRGFAVGGDVTLTDDKDQPLRNTTFVYVLGDDRGAIAGQTDSEGRAVIAGVAPITGDAVVALTVRGGSDVVAAQYKAPTLKVVGPATPLGYAALVGAVLALLLLVALVVAAVLLRRRQLEEARDILDEAIRDLLAGNEYAGTIFLAYRRFGAYLARHGFAEKATDTPREFALGVRKALPIGAVALRQLIGLFEEAKYSDHPIGSAERDGAVRSLGEVRRELDSLLGSKKVSA